MNDAKNISVAKPKATGGVARGPAGTDLPTDATAALATDLAGLGYVGKGGLKLKQDRKVEKFTAWGGKIVHVAQTEFGETWTLSLIESRKDKVLEAIFGEDRVTVTEGVDGALPSIHVEHSEDEQDPCVWVFDMKTGKTAGRRVVLPMGKLTEVGDVTYSDDELIAYEVTIDALPGDDGVCAHEYIN